MKIEQSKIVKQAKEYSKISDTTHFIVDDVAGRRVDKLALAYICGAKWMLHELGGVVNVKL